MIFKNTLVVLALFLPISLSAKGLDELTPEVEKAEKETPVPEAKDDAATADGGETKPGDASGKVEAPPAATPAPTTVTPVAGSEPAPAKPSELSQKLANKMYLASGFGFIGISGRPGAWSSATNADAEVGYFIKDDPFPGTMLAKITFFGTFRYEAIDVVVNSNHQSYRGVVEGYHLGAKGVHQLDESIKTVGSVELGVLITHLDPTDGFEKDEDLEKTGLAATLSGGCDWTILEKVTIGPRLSFGLGSLRTVRLGAMAGFSF